MLWEHIFFNVECVEVRKMSDKKGTPNMRFLNNLYSGPNLVFFSGTALGRFGQVYFYYYLSSSANHGARNFYSPPLPPPIPRLPAP